MDNHEGDALKRWMEKRGISVGDLASMLGTSTSNISYLLKNPKIPPKHRYKLAKEGFDIQAKEIDTTTEGYILREWIKSNGMLVKDVAEKIGVVPQYLTNMFSRKTIPLRVKKQLRDLGIKAFELSDNIIDNVSVVSEPNVEYRGGESTAKRSRVVHAQAYGGYLTGLNDENFIMSLPEHYIYVDEPGTYRTFEVKGDSMEPEFPSGCLVDAKKLDPVHWKKLIKGHVFVFVHDELGLQIKMLLKQSGSKVTFRAINEFYDDFEIDLKDVRELWYFVQKHDTNRDYSRYLLR